MGMLHAGVRCEIIEATGDILWMKHYPFDTYIEQDFLYFDVITPDTIFLFPFCTVSNTTTLNNKSFLFKLFKNGTAFYEV